MFDVKNDIEIEPGLYYYQISFKFLGQLLLNLIISFGLIYC